MVALPGISHIVIFSAFILQGSPEGIKHLTVNLILGRQGLLKCPHPLKLKDKEFIVYWQNNDKTICYDKTNEESVCAGFQHHVAEGEIILTIPKVEVSHSGNYTCFVHTEDKSFECRIKLLVTAGKSLKPGSNGIHIKAGPIFLLLPLAMVIWNLPFLLL